MNATGMIRTIASCQGHGEACGKQPYVYFDAPEWVAASMQRLLTEALIYSGDAFAFAFAFAIDVATFGPFNDNPAMRSFVANYDDW